jgi:CubicO group peptidase (beta-lactamase class C family)
VRALEQIEAWGCTAAVALVDAHGKVHSHGDRTRPFRLASVTKALVAYAAAIALEEGAVHLDDAAGPPGSTLRHLLAHCSGLPFDGDRPIARPEQRRIYSNTGWVLAAEHVARVTGFATSQYLTEAVLDPLSMRDTTLQGNPGGAAVGTVADLCRFLTELMHPTLIDRSTLTTATTVQFPGLRGMLPGVGRFSPLDWGLGYQLHSSASMTWTGSRTSPATFGHFGATGTFMFVDPERQMAMACLTDKAFGPWALEAWPRLVDAVYDEM